MSSSSSSSASEEIAAVNANPTSEGLKSLRHSTWGPPSPTASESNKADPKRIGFGVKSQEVYDSVTYNLNKIAWYPDRHPIPAQCCSVFGLLRFDKAHVLTAARKFTYKLQPWMVICGILPSDKNLLLRVKSQYTNVLPLHHDFACKMEPDLCGFTLFPTRDTLCQIAYLCEDTLSAAEASSESFLGFRAERFLDKYPLRHRVGKQDIKIYEYDVQLWLDFGIYPKVERHYIKKVKTYKQKKMSEPITFPQEFKPKIPAVKLPLDPLIVIASSQLAIRRRKDDKKKAAMSIREAEYEKIFELAEYILQLCEVERPSSWRTLKRPEQLTRRRPSEITRPNDTHRWYPDPPCKDTQFVADDATYGEQPLPKNSGEASRTRSAGPDADCQSEEPEVRRSERIKGKQRADEETTSQLSSAEPSPDLSQGGASTPSDGSAEWLPPLRNSPYQFNEEYNTDDSCTPPFTALPCPFGTLEEWRDNTSNDLDAFVKEAIAPYVEQKSSKSLKLLRTTFDSAEEAVIGAFEDLLHHIDDQISRAAEGSDVEML